MLLKTKYIFYFYSRANFTNFDDDGDSDNGRYQKEDILRPPTLGGHFSTSTVNKIMLRN